MPLGDSHWLSAVYRRRFNADERVAKAGVWRVLCERYFARYVSPASTVLDVGAGDCEFINHIRAGRRIAVDLNPDLAAHAGSGVEAHVGPSHPLGFLGDESVDLVFSSNFLEHLPNKAAIMATVAEMVRVLKPSGRVCLMGPNIRYVREAYWDYYDHHVPLTERSVTELLESSGLVMQECHPRFLPYTVKGSLPAHPLLVRLYLALGPVSYRLLGKQFLVVATKRG